MFKNAININKLIVKKICQQFIKELVFVRNRFYFICLNIHMFNKQLILNSKFNNHFFHFSIIYC